MKPITVPALQRMKENAEKIVMLTAYDAGFARLSNEAGVDVILVGDSLGTVISGYNDTVAVTLDQMIYHTRCVAAVNRRALLITDLPFMTYATLEQSLQSAMQLMQAGAMMVKLEGGAFLAQTIVELTCRGIPVCAHLGLTPQSIHLLGGYKVQGRHAPEIEQLIADALALEAAGARMLVLECVIPAVAQEITERLKIPVIGIGSGSGCDGQVLVCHDMVGITDKSPTFVKNFLPEAGARGILGAIECYVAAVKSGEFPGKEHCFS